MKNLLIFLFSLMTLSLFGQFQQYETVRLKGVTDGKFIAVKSDGTHRGAHVTQWHGRWTRGFKWRFIPIGNGYFKIKNDCGKILVGSRRTNMCHIDDSYSAGKYPSAQWKVVTGNWVDRVYLINKETGKAIAPPLRLGDRVRLVNYNANDRKQMWNIEYAQKTDRPAPRGTQVLTVGLRETGHLFPTLTNGDRDFWGHGPNSNLKISFRITRDYKKIYADVTYEVSESVPNNTEAKGKKSYFLYSAPAGKYIHQILTPTRADLFWVDKNHNEEAFRSGATPFIKRIRSKGDTMGNDIGTTFDDAYVKIEFNRIKIAVSNSRPRPYSGTIF